MREEDDDRRPGASLLRGAARQGAPRHEIGSDLSAVSVDELDERIAQLEGEILRLKEEKDRKNASRDAASAFFR